MNQAASFIASFAASVETFLAETEMPATRLGMLAVNDPNFVGDLRKGREPSAKLMDRVSGWMAEHRAASGAGASTVSA